MVGAGEVGGQDEGEAADWAFARKRADFGATARAEVAGSRGFGVAGTKGGKGRDGAGGKAHCEQGVSCFVGGGVGGGVGYGGSGM